MAICHCDDCQRQTGTAFSVIVAFRRGDLLLAGEAAASHTTRAATNGAQRERRFCASCGSPMVTFLADMPDLVLVKAGTLDDRSWLEPDIEIWCESAQGWLELSEGRERFKRDGLGSRLPPVDHDG